MVRPKLEPYAATRAKLSCVYCGQVVIEVVDRKARPEVPSPDKLQGGGLCMHEQYLELMRQCWSTDANARPGFEAVIARLRFVLSLRTEGRSLYYWKAHPSSVGLHERQR